MIEVKLLTDTSRKPTRGTPQSAGLDLYADQAAVIAPGGRALIRTGIAVALEPGTAGLIWPRSGMAARSGIDVLAGVIDSDYRDEVGVVLLNTGHEPFRVHSGDRIAQMLMQRVDTSEPVVVHELGDSERQGGFGSTGR